MPDNNINLESLGKASFPGMKTPHSHAGSVEAAAAELIVDGSIELSVGTAGRIDAVKEVLPYGTPVFVPLLPLHDMESRLEIIARLHEAGFEPVPHIAARRISNRENLLDFLSRVTAKGGVKQVLLIGGDTKEQSGPWASAHELLADGVLAESGIREVGFAGYPEGHPRLESSLLEEALCQKLSLAAEQGLGAHVITQFSFMPQRILDYCIRLAGLAPETPVYVGMAGPARLKQLVHFARYCGVAASLSAVRDVGVKVAQLVDHRRADEQLASLATYTAHHDSSNIVGVHVFSFGGFLESATWMNGYLNAGS